MDNAVFIEEGHPDHPFKLGSIIGAHIDHTLAGDFL